MSNLQQQAQQYAAAQQQSWTPNQPWNYQGGPPPVNPPLPSEAPPQPPPPDDSKTNNQGTPWSSGDGQWNQNDYPYYNSWQGQGQGAGNTWSGQGEAGSAWSGQYNWGQNNWNQYYGNTVPPPPPVQSIDTNPPAAPANKSKVTLDEANDPELIEFDEQFKTWEKKFDAWREENKDHPDKDALAKYEETWTKWRDELLQKREEIKKSKLEKLSSKSETPASAPEPPTSSASTDGSQSHPGNDNNWNQPTNQWQNPPYQSSGPPSGLPGAPQFGLTGPPPPLGAPPPMHGPPGGPPPPSTQGTPEGHPQDGASGTNSSMQGPPGASPLMQGRQGGPSMMQGPPGGPPPMQGPPGGPPPMQGPPWGPPPMQGPPGGPPLMQGPSGGPPPMKGPPGGPPPMKGPPGGPPPMKGPPGGPPPMQGPPGGPPPMKGPPGGPPPMQGPPGGPPPMQGHPGAPPSKHNSLGGPPPSFDPHGAPPSTHGPSGDPSMRGPPGAFPPMHGPPGAPPMPRSTGTDSPHGKSQNIPQGRSSSTSKDQYQNPNDLNQEHSDENDKDQPRGMNSEHSGDTYHGSPFGRNQGSQFQGFPGNQDRGRPGGPYGQKGGSPWQSNQEFPDRQSHGPPNRFSRGSDEHCEDSSKENDHEEGGRHRGPLNRPDNMGPNQKYTGPPHDFAPEGTSKKYPGPSQDKGPSGYGPPQDGDNDGSNEKFQDPSQEFGDRDSGGRYKGPPHAGSWGGQAGSFHSAQGHFGDDGSGENYQGQSKYKNQGPPSDFMGGQSSRQFQGNFSDGGLDRKYRNQQDYFGHGNQGPQQEFGSGPSHGGPNRKDQDPPHSFGDGPNRKNQGPPHGFGDWSNERPQGNFGDGSNERPQGNFGDGPHKRPQCMAHFSDGPDGKYQGPPHGVDDQRFRSSSSEFGPGGSDGQFQSYPNERGNRQNQGAPNERGPKGQFQGPPNERGPQGKYQGTPNERDPQQQYQGPLNESGPQGRFQGPSNERGPQGRYQGPPNERGSQGRYQGPPNERGPGEEGHQGRYQGPPNERGPQGQYQGTPGERGPQGRSQGPDERGRQLQNEGIPGERGPQGRYQGSTFESDHGNLEGLSDYHKGSPGDSNHPREQYQGHPGNKFRGMAQDAKHGDSKEDVDGKGFFDRNNPFKPGGPNRQPGHFDKMEGGNRLSYNEPPGRDSYGSPQGDFKQLNTGRGSLGMGTPLNRHGQADDSYNSSVDKNSDGPHRKGMYGRKNDNKGMEGNEDYNKPSDSRPWDNPRGKTGSNTRGGFQDSRFQRGTSRDHLDKKNPFMVSKRPESDMPFESPGDARSGNRPCLLKAPDSLLGAYREGSRKSGSSLLGDYDPNSANLKGKGDQFKNSPGFDGNQFGSNEVNKAREYVYQGEKVKDKDMAPGKIGATELSTKADWNSGEAAKNSDNIEMKSQQKNSGEEKESDDTNLLSKQAMSRATGNILELFRQKSQGSASGSIPGLDITPKEEKSKNVDQEDQKNNSGEKKDVKTQSPAKIDKDIIIKVPEGRLNIGPIGVAQKPSSWKPPQDWYEDEEDESTNAHNQKSDGKRASDFGESNAPPHKLVRRDQDNRPPALMDQVIEPPVTPITQEQSNELPGAQGNVRFGAPGPGQITKFRGNEMNRFDTPGFNGNQVRPGRGRFGGPDFNRFPTPGMNRFEQPGLLGNPFARGGRSGDNSLLGPGPGRGMPFGGPNRGMLGRGGRGQNMNASGPFFERGASENISPHSTQDYPKQDIDWRAPHEDRIVKVLDYGHGSTEDHNQHLIRNESLHQTPKEADYAPPIQEIVIDEPVADTITIDDLIAVPGRFMRPPKLVILLRGLPGSGKTTMAQMIKNKEIENGGSAPRILCLDDYFMVEVENMVMDAETGRKIKMKAMEYEFEQELEENYRSALIRSFKKQVDEKFFPFIIIDCINSHVKHFKEICDYAKKNDFEPYIAPIDADVQTCTQRNIHGRKSIDIQRLSLQWELAPTNIIRLDLTSYIQDADIQEVEMEDTMLDEPQNSDKDEHATGEEEEEGEETFKIINELMKSKWDTVETQEAKLDKLDGVRAAKKRKGEPKPQSIEDWLQLSKEFENRTEQPGKKRVRWADIEERQLQEAARDRGFVLGQTDWQRMTDPSLGSTALVEVIYF